MSDEASAWVRRWTPLIAGGGSVLDVACGQGRHVRWLAGQGYRVTGVDRNADAIASLTPWGEMVAADIEEGPWPFDGRRFDAVVVTNYLWRPLMGRIVDAVGVGGVLIYETFAQGHQTIGRPSNPDHLLRPGELLALASSLRIVAYEDGFLGTPERFVQRVAAVREAAPVEPPARYPL